MQYNEIDLQYQAKVITKHTNKMTHFLADRTCHQASISKFLKKTVQNSPQGL